MQATPSPKGNLHEGRDRQAEIIARTSSVDGQFTRFKALTENEYSEFCEKLPRSELYRCRGCDFVHRFPSKVRRHFHYRHSVVPPYRCGHCSFRAVERGKVVKHCASAHPTRRLSVLTRDDELTVQATAAADAGADENAFQRPGDARKPYDLSGLRNIGKPTVSGGETSKAERAKTTPAPPSSAAADDDSSDASDDDVESAADSTGNNNDNRNEDIEEEEEEDDDDDDEIADDLPCDHIPCETIFAINRTTYMQRPPSWRSQTTSERSDRQDSSSSARQSSITSYLSAATTTIQIKTEPDNDHEYQSATNGSATIQAPTPRPNAAPTTDLRRKILPLRPPVTPPVGVPTGQRHYYCIYCGMSSRWNKRDVRLHVMHVHVGVRAFCCGHCGFGNSKSRAVVRSHCSKYHAGREPSIIDNEPMFEAVDVIQEQDGLIAVALTSSDGTPLLSLDELDKYCTSKNIKFRSPTSGRKPSEPRARLPDPKTVREAIRSSLNNQCQPHDRPDDEQPTLEASPENSYSSELYREQMEELGCQWKCSQCAFRDLVFERVESHFVEQHMQLKPYSCPHCHKYFSESEEVLTHIDDNHAGREREFVSTVDEKSSYILRNIECVSVEVEPVASSRQFQTVDAVQAKSNGKHSELEGDTNSVPRTPNDEGHGKNIHHLKPAERQQTRKTSATVTSSSTQERNPSSASSKNILSLGEELCDESPTFSDSLTEQDEAATNKAHSVDENVTSVVQSHLATGENLGHNETNVRNDPTISGIAMTSLVDHVITDVPAEDRDLLRHSENGKEQATGQLDDLLVPSVTSKITNNEENADTGALNMPTEEQESLDSSRSNERTNESNDAPVLSITTSYMNVYAGNTTDDDPPTLTEEQELARVLAPRSSEQNHQFDDVSSSLPSNPCIGTCEEVRNSSLIVHAKHSVTDASPASAKQQRSFNDTSFSTEQVYDIPIPSNFSNNDMDEENSEDVQSNSANEKTDPVSADHESAKSSPEEQPSEQPSNFPSQLTKTGTETVDANRIASHGENRQLFSSQIIDGESFSIIVKLSRPRVRASVLPQHVTDGQTTTVNPQERVAGDFKPRSNGPSEALVEERETSNSFTDKPFSDVAAQRLDSEDRGLVKSAANDDGLSSTDSRPPPAQVNNDGDDDDDDGMNSDSSTSSSDGAKSPSWRCDDCSFVAASESLLVAHQRSRQQYRCLYCPDFHHSSVVHMRHHCLTRHPGKPISYKHTELPCADVKTPTATPGKIPAAASAGQSAANTQTATRPKLAETRPKSAEIQLKFAKTSSPHAAAVSTPPENHAAKTPSPGTEKSAGEDYCLMDLEESSRREKFESNEFLEESSNEESEESDNSEDDDWEEYVPKKKKSKMTSKKNNRITSFKTPPKDDGAFSTNADGAQGTIVCDLCSSYTTSNSTVMRHHIMSHLHYYPYYCPYCTSFRSVRGFPITKHIRMKHPGQAERFECNPDPEMETKIRNSSHRAKSGQKEHRASAPVEQMDNFLGQPPPPQLTEPAAQPNNPPALEEHREQVLPAVTAVTAVANKNRRILYKCKICGLKTHLKGDFRHHIMRELQYKPFKCAYCDYSEPCQWSLGKHFRLKHPGSEPKTREVRDPEKDARVEEMVEECVIQLTLTPGEADSSTWKPPGAAAQRGMRKRPAGMADHTAQPAPPQIIHPVIDNSPIPLLSPASSAAYDTPPRPPDFRSKESKLGEEKWPEEKAPKVYRCPYCPYTNTNGKLFSGHKVLHNTPQLRCSYCGHLDHYPSRMMRHTRRRHPGMAAKYARLADGSQSESDLSQSSSQRGITADDDDADDCEVIGSELGSNELRQEHGTPLNSQLPLRCFYCSLKFQHRFEVQRHCEFSHTGLPVRWTDNSAPPPSPGVTTATLQQQMNAMDRLKYGGVTLRQSKISWNSVTADRSSSGVTLRQPTISECMGGARRLVHPTPWDNDTDDDDDDDDDDSDDSEVEVETQTTPSSGSGGAVGRGLKFCCHLCAFVVRSDTPLALVAHLRQQHQQSAASLLTAPRINSSFY